MGAKQAAWRLAGHWMNPFSAVQPDGRILSYYSERK